HRGGPGSLYYPRTVAIALEQLPQLVTRDASEHGGVGDLVTVQMKDRHHDAVACGIEELVRVPRRGERSCLRFAVTDYTRDHQLRMIERRAVGMRQRVAELAALVDGTRR